MNHQKGFTLIELVVVVIILGVLAALAIPKITYVSNEASNAAAKGVLAALASGSAINYAAKQAGNAGALTLNAANVCTPVLLQPLLTGTSVLLTAGVPTVDGEFQIASFGGPADCSGVAVTAICYVTLTPGLSVPGPIFCAR